MKPAGTQTDKNMNFDGMESMAPSRSSKYMTNHYTGHMNDGRLVNKGRGPTTAGQTGHKTPGTVGGVPAVPAQGSVRDNINRGAQVRTPGGTRDWMPSKTQNYNGNPDKIRVGQSGGPGYGQTQKGSRPTTSASQSDFNYGPKKQY
jgi:hypothetical protein